MAVPRSLARRSVLVLGCAGLIVAPAGATAAESPCAHPANRPWCDSSQTAGKRAALLTAALTQDEKISLIAGGPPNGHTGATAAVPRVGLPSSYMTDGPVGVRQGNATAMPAPIALAATFDPALAELYGATVGQEAKAKGNTGLLAPTVNMMRTPLGGRTFEGFGEDPFLVARTTVRWIQGAQRQGVYATVKHFAANNQEGSDPTGLAGPASLPLNLGLAGNRYLQNSVLDERTLREVYLPQFEAAVKDAGVGAVMCSYNRLNGPWACANDGLINGILKSGWGFKGMVMSDFTYATHIFGTNDHLHGGLDLEMPAADAYYAPLVKTMLGTVPGGTAALDDHVRRILHTLFAAGFFDEAPHEPDDGLIDKPAHRAASQRVAAASITLLKNDGVLPLKASRKQSVAVVGPYADHLLRGGGSGLVSPFSQVTALAGIRARSAGNVTYDDGSDAGRAAAVARAADVAVVVVGQFQTEGLDRSCMTLECPDAKPDQDALVAAILAAQPNTVVVLQTGGPVLTPWRNRAKAILETWFAGDQGGTALARVLYGDVDPGGRLPVTFPKSEDQEQTAGDAEKYPGVLETVSYKEGVLVGYRWFDAHRFEPAFEFGSGLSYTRFSYGGLKVTPAKNDALGLKVSLRVRNTGKRRGYAVPQLYLGVPAAAGVVQPPRKLAGYQKLSIARRHYKRAEFTVDRRALSYWDTPRMGWEVTKGCYRLMVGTSSREILREATVAVRGADCPGAVARLGA